ncbi:MAG: glycosyltransferase family protein [Planctomycetota bacterium]
MAYNIRIVSTFPPRKCGIGTFSRDLVNALKDFKSDVRQINVAAIDNRGLKYEDPVDLTIDQYSRESWRQAAAQIAVRAHKSMNRTVVLLQHEYGLDPDQKGRTSRGTNFVSMARTLTEKGLITLVYLHTLLERPDLHQRRVIQNLAQHSDGLIVTTQSATDILESPAYGIRRSKIMHIDHGIRMQNRFQYDRLMIKQQYGLDNKLLITTLGLRSPDKGIQYGIRAYGRFLNESCTWSQRRKCLYLIAGQCHPELIKAEDGRHHRHYQATLNNALEQSRLKWCDVKELGDPESLRCEVVLLDAFLDEDTLLKLYGATNIMVLPYLNMQQMSSGVLADTVGSGRVAIATKFRYATELIDPESKGRQGIVIGPHARGVLVDPGEPSVEQIAQGLDYLVFNRDERLRMEKRAHRRGYQMRWENAAWQLMQYIQFIREKRDIVSGRGIEFKRVKSSLFDRKYTE